MKVIKKIKITNEEIEEIKVKNASYAALKELFKEMDDATPKNVIKVVVDELSKAKFAYDSWFSNMESKYNVLTSKNNSWNVDFDTGELQLMEI